MAVEVWKSQKEEKDPLDKLVKLTSIGVGVAGLANKGGGSESSAMDRRMKTLESSDVGQGAKLGNSLTDRTRHMKPQY